MHRRESCFMSIKTNAARTLDKLGIVYEVREYPVDPDDLSAEKVATGIGLPLCQVYKTLVARGDRRGVLLAVLSGDMELDLKSLAKLSGDRKVEMAPLKDVQPLTGYIRDRTGYDYLHHAEVGSSNAAFVGDEVTDRFCVLGSTDDHVAKLHELAEAGVDQFNIYLMNGDEEQILEVYGREIIPAMSGVTARAS